MNCTPESGGKKFPFEFFSKGIPSLFPLFRGQFMKEDFCYFYDFYSFSKA